MLSSRRASEQPFEWPGVAGLRAARRAAQLVFSSFHAIGRAEAGRTAAQQAFALHNLCADICRAHSFEVEAVGTPPRGAAVLVANHLSYLDPVVLATLAPLVLIGKLEVEKWPMIGDVGRTHGVLFVKRGDPYSGARVLRGALTALRAGVPVLNFPEGTTTDGGQLLPFKRGVFGVARLAGVPVIPVALRFEAKALHWVGGATFLPHYLRTAARPRTIVRVTYGEPLSAPPGVRAELVAAAARARLGEMLAKEGS